MPLSGHLLAFLTEIRSFTSRLMHGVCSAQTAGECQGARTSVPTSRLGRRANPTPKLGNLPVFDLRLEGLILNLQNPMLDDGVR
jgi:hypothetical protein